LDTSVVSHLLAFDAPEKHGDTIRLWEQLKENEYEVVISPVVLEEVGRCEKELADELMDYLNELDVTIADETDVMIALSRNYLSTGVLTEKSINDCRHIAIASVSGCQYILSWNMKHFVKLKIMKMVQEVNGRLGIFQPIILTPSIFIKGDEENG
jgi:predicted nucleic acid-binding protein